MTTTFKVRVNHGVLEPLEKIDLPEWQGLTVTIKEKTAKKKDKWYIPSVSDEEQKEIEEILKKPDCHIIDHEKNITVKI